MPHSKKTVRAFVNKKRAEARAAGRCPNCLKRPVKEGLKACEPCLASHRAKDKRFRDRVGPARKALGLCRRCGDLAVEGKSLCGYHAEEVCERNAARFARWKGDGKCIQCGKDPEPGKVRCRPCQDWQNAYLREWRKKKRLAEEGVATLRATRSPKSVKKAG